MREHDAIREMLALAAAEALDEKEERRVAEHLLECEACAAEMDQWRALGRGLRRLPAVQAPAVLVEQTRQRLQMQLAAARGNAASPWLMGFLVLLSWTLAVATWPILRILTAGIASWLELDFQSMWTGLVSYTLAGWAIGGLAAVALAWRRVTEGRTA